MLLLRVEDCLVCLALDVVDGVFERPDPNRGVAPTFPIVDWAAVSGVGVSSAPDGEGSLVVVRTESGPVGLRARACLGVRDVSFVESPPIPTRLLGKDGRPLCYLLLVDQQPHFLIEPQALARAASQTRAPRAESTGIAALTPRAEAGV